MDLQIPPANSPLLQPHQVRSDSGTHSYGLGLVDDPLDGIEFLGPGQWEGPSGGKDDDDDEDDNEEGLDELDDFTLEQGHIVGVPSSSQRLDPR